jgi:glycosyltransferase involved in cell wall biosynthesis
MTASKPVLLVTTSTFPRWEGDSEPRFVYDLSKRLCDNFHVIVLAPHYAGATTHEVRDGMTIYRYRYAPAALETLAYEGGITANLKQQPWKLALLPLLFAGQWLVLRKLLKQYPVTTLHAHWLIPQGVIAVLGMLGLKHKPALVCTSHGGDLFGLQDTFSTRLKRWVIRHCNALSVVSHAMLPAIETLAGKASPPVAVIPMGTDLTQTFVPNPNSSRHPSQLLFVGRLVEKKGLKHLLQALQQLLPQHPDLQLLIAGSGPLQTELETQVRQAALEQHIIFTGRLEHAELVKLYQQATLAVFPFIQAQNGDMEGLGLVMVEAMGCGCPVLASDMPAVRDVIRHGENGYLAEAGNAAALASAIHTLLDQPALREQFAQQGLQTVQQHFDWPPVTQRYQMLLHASQPPASTVEIAHAH